MNKLPERIRAVIFDLDGTLVDSMRMWYNVDKEYLARFGVEMPADLQRQIAGMNAEQTAWYFIRTFGIDRTPDRMMAEWHEMALEEYRSRLDLKDGAREILPWLKARGYRTGMGTTGFRTLSEMFLEGRGLRPYMDAIVCTEDVERGKPAPDIFLKCAERLGVEPGDCAVVEDLPEGLMAARNAGMLPIAVRDRDSAEMEARKRAVAAWYIESLRELMRE